MLNKFKDMLLNNPNLRQDLLRIAVRSRAWVFVVLFSYLGASILSALVMNILSTSVSKNIPQGGTASAKSAGHALLSRESVNYHEVKKNIMDRNIFNSSGKFPDEKLEVREGADSKRDTFNIDGPCSKTSLNINLVGTIFYGTRLNSFAVIREKGFTQSDVYAVGDTIIGEESAVIAAVEPQSVIINNAGVKECLELDKPKGSVDPYAGGGSGGMVPPPTTSAVAADGTVEIAITEVEQAAGSGGEGLLNSGRIVPVNDPETNQMQGFKLISVKAGGLFSKIGLSDGDVITEVNGTSLKEPDKGYQFYQVFEDETDIKISFLKNGKQPATINVTIK